MGRRRRKAILRVASYGRWAKDIISVDPTAISSIYEILIRPQVRSLCDTTSSSSLRYPVELSSLLWRSC